MGNQQAKYSTKKFLSYQQQKPQQIEQLQRLINQSSYKKVQAQSQFRGQYNLMLKSADYQKHIYGIKLTNKQLSQDQNLTVQKLTDFVQIYIIPQSQKSKKQQLIFQGQMVNGKRNNFGVEYNIKGQLLYQGFFKNNKYHGWGLTKTYKGEWAQGTKCGYGIYKSISMGGQKQKNQRITYQGKWRDNRFHGLGAMNITIEQIQVFINPNFVPLNAEIAHCYIGEWVEGAKCGVGKSIITKNVGNTTKKEIYQGQFVNNLYHGQGKIKYDQTMQFKKGKFISGNLV